MNDSYVNRFGRPDPPFTPIVAVYLATLLAVVLYLLAVGAGWAP